MSNINCWSILKTTMLICGYCLNCLLITNELLDSQKKQQQIYIGSTLDLSKGLKISGIKYDETIKYIISNQNAEGGVHGKPLQFTSFDDQYTPAKALENIKNLKTKYDTDIILFPTGTSTLNAFIDFARKEKILVLFPGSGSSLFRKPNLRYVINLGASYFQEGYVLTNHMIKSLRAKKIAFFYQNDEFGRDLLRGARQAIREVNFSEKDYIEVAYERNNLQLGDDIATIKDIKVDAICFFSTAIAALSFIRQFGVEEIRSKKMVGCSELGISEFQEFIKHRSLKAVVSNFLPNPAQGTTNNRRNYPIVKQFQQAVKESGGKLALDIITFEAYIGTTLLIKVLQGIKGSITKESIISSFEQMNKYDFGGLHLDFNSKTRQLLHAIWLDTGQPEWTKIEIATKKDDDDKHEQEGFF